jgi:PAS domain S-box-containing protein
MKDADRDDSSGADTRVEPAPTSPSQEPPLTQARLEAERQRLEARWRESERELLEAQHIAALGTWKWEVARDEVSWSPELFRILGYEPDSHRPSRRAFLDRVHPEDRPLLEDRIAALLRNRKPFSLDHRILLPDDSIRHVHSVARVECNAQGSPVRLFGILQDVTERKRSEEELRLKDSAVESSISGIGITDLEGRLVYVNDSLVRMWGYEDRREILGRFLPDFWEGDGVTRTVEALRKSGCHTGEDVGRRKDGSLFPVEFSACMLKDAQGNPRHMYGSFVDITERKRATEELRDLGRRLIDAQEEERRRLARELHDDVSQRLALLEVELELMGQAPGPGPELTEKTAKLAGRVKELSSDVHHLSYRLHPRRLERLGLTAALRSLCREVGEQQQIHLEFEEKDVPTSLGEDMSLCLYRVAQESLQNVVRHSGAQTATLRLRAEPGELRLVVTDPGAGFEPEETGNRRGLGIVSMRERLRALGGRLSIRSAPGLGTTVVAVVPL